MELDKKLGVVERRWNLNGSRAKPVIRGEKYTIERKRNGIVSECGDR
jgi:hypothetical protein